MATIRLDKSTYLRVINPANEEVIGHASKATPVDVEKALKSAQVCEGFRSLEANTTLAKILYY